MWGSHPCMLIIRYWPGRAQPPNIFAIEQLAPVPSLTIWGAFYAPQGLGRQTLDTWPHVSSHAVRIPLNHWPPSWPATSSYALCHHPNWFGACPPAPTCQDDTGKPTSHAPTLRALAPWHASPTPGCHSQKLSASPQLSFVPPHPGR